MKFLINIIIILFLFLIQSGFISGLPLIFSQTNLVLVALVFILILRGLYISFYWAICFGVLFDLYFFLPPGSHLISFLISLFLANIFLSNVFTNRSLYSFMALTFLTVLFYKICLYSIGYGVQFLTGQHLIQFSNRLVYPELFGIGMDLVLTFIAFSFMASSNRMKPVFIKK